MFFKVSEKIKGSYVLSSLNKVLIPGAIVSISKNELREPDVKSSIKSSVLIPIDKDYNSVYLKSSPDVVVLNNTKKVLVLGKIVLRPKASLIITVEEAGASPILTAKEKGLISILSDEEEHIHEVEKAAEDDGETVYSAPKSGEDKAVTPVVWDFRSQEAKKAEPVPKSEDIVKIEDDDEKIDFIDKEEAKKKTKKKVKKKSKKKTVKKKAKKKATKKTSKKKKVKNETEKKDIEKKARKVSNIKPVGEEKKSKTAADAAIELDSRGNPIGDKPSETMKHLIDSFGGGDEVDFVDQEQAKERHEKRTDMD